MVDSGLMASILNWKMDQVRLDSDRSSKLIETFAFNKIMAQVDAGDGRYELFHYRDREKRQIDFLIEREDNALLGIEVKAGSAVAKEDFRHMRWFQKSLGKNQAFVGIILYTGEFPVSFGNNFSGCPLWSLVVVIHNSKVAMLHKFLHTNLKVISFKKTHTSSTVPISGFCFGIPAAIFGSNNSRKVDLKS
jgi:predicted AAA+ superfamily ATPase